MRKQLLMGSIAMIVIALGVAASAQRAGGPGQNPPANPPPAQGGQAQGQMGPGGQGPGAAGQMGQGMPDMPGMQGGQGMRGRGGMMGPANGPGQPGGRGGRGGRGGGQGGPGGQEPMALLNLTPEQQASLARIRLDAEDGSATFLSQGRELRAELHRAAFGDTKDAAKLTDLTTRILANEKQVLEIQTKSQTEIAAVLTAEQRKKMRVMGAGGGR